MHQLYFRPMLNSFKTYLHDLVKYSPGIAPGKPKTDFIQILYVNYNLFDYFKILFVWAPNPSFFSLQGLPWWNKQIFSNFGNSLQSLRFDAGLNSTVG